ncbi:MAG TPA: hypothetical protein VMS14_10540 [Ilumatobacteraceae bacterium]|nr:hypothetical protein [Ilumatobacteraceae bacterium]
MPRTWSTSDPIPLPAPIRSRDEALDLLHAIVQRPLRAETWCIPLDDAGVGGVAVAVNDTVDPDAVLEVVDSCARALTEMPFTCMFVATIRPDDDLLTDDDDRWLAACDLAADHDIDLLDWIVVGPSGSHFPSDLVEAIREWPQADQWTWPLPWSLS